MLKHFSIKNALS